jgi:hypothetical protein
LKRHVRAQPGEVLQRFAVYRRGARREVCVRHALAAERRGLPWQRLRGPGGFARDVGRRHGNLLDRKEWLAGLPVEDEHMARLRDLRDGGVPDVVMRHLEMPFALPRSRVEAEQ